MCSSRAADSASEIVQLARLVQGLTAAVHHRGDDGPDQAQLRELAEANARLGELRRRNAAVDRQGQHPTGPDRAAGLMLGPETTGLRVDTRIRLKPVPTGVYHLLDPETDPLLTVTVRNESHEPRRVCVTAYIEGISAQSIKTIEFGRGDRQEQVVHMLPSLIPEHARRITEIQRCTLHVKVELFASIRNDRTRTEGWASLIESHDTYSLVLMARNSSFHSVIDPETGRRRDLTKYYGAWVTPHVEPVQALVRKAAERLPDRRIWGYQGSRDANKTADQVQALFEALKDAGLLYVDSVIDFGAGPGQVTQRTRLPRESLRLRCANCIDGTVLFASLLESASLHAAIVLVPGHAFVAWETWRDSDDWDYLETTMIGSHGFEEARQRARMLFRRFADEDFTTDDEPIPRVLKLNDLRAKGVWPME